MAGLYIPRWRKRNPHRHHFWEPWASIASCWRSVWLEKSKYTNQTWSRNATTLGGYVLRPTRLPKGLGQHLLSQPTCCLAGHPPKCLLQGWGQAHEFPPPRSWGACRLIHSQCHFYSNSQMKRWTSKFNHVTHATKYCWVELTQEILHLECMKPFELNG